MRKRAILNVEQLPELCVPVVHSFSNGALAADAFNAGGTPANDNVTAALGGIPAPVVASFGNAEGTPFDVFPPHVP